MELEYQISEGLVSEIALCKQALAKLIRSGERNTETWNLVLKTIDLLESLQREERAERQRLENAELARLKHELASKKIEGFVSEKEYQQALKAVRSLIEEFVPRDRLNEFAVALNARVPKP